MSGKQRRNIRVGFFVTVLTLAAAVAIFVLGGSTDLLEDRYTLNASYQDVAGLKTGSVVELAGIQVGEVAAIRISDDLGVKEIFVEMKLMTRYQDRIRRDSEARIDSIGLLGDKKVAISIGSKGEPLLEDGDWIRTRPPLDLLEYQSKVGDVLNSTASIGHKVDLMLGRDEEAAQASLATSFGHLEELLREAKEGDGLIHALVYDKSMTRKVDRTLTNLEEMSVSLKHVANEVQTGDGLANELIYGDDGAALAAELAQLADALHGLTTGLKNEDSLVHALLYEPEHAELVEDVAAMADALRATSEAIESGDGTLGMLARDPALYEDLRALVGGAQRNKLLRAYIRQTVKKGEDNNAGPWEPAE